MADITRTLGLQKRIALIAHDHKKQALIRWCQKNRDILGQHFLCGTGTTARLISENTGLPVEALKSGPLGGDQEVGARIDVYKRQPSTLRRYPKGSARRLAGSDRSPPGPQIPAAESLHSPGWPCEFEQSSSRLPPECPGRAAPMPHAPGKIPDRSWIRPR